MRCEVTKWTRWNEMKHTLVSFLARAFKVPIYDDEGAIVGCWWLVGSHTADTGGMLACVVETLDSKQEKVKERCRRQWEWEKGR